MQRTVHLLENVYNFVNVYKLCSCGGGLQHLMDDAEVKSLLYGTTMQAQNEEKWIYHPGSLRKVGDDWRLLLKFYQS